VRRSSERSVPIQAPPLLIYFCDRVSSKDPNPEQMQKLDDIYKRLKK